MTENNEYKNQKLVDLFIKSTKVEDIESMATRVETVLHTMVKCDAPQWLTAHPEFMPAIGSKGKSVLTFQLGGDDIGILEVTFGFARSKDGHLEHYLYAKGSGEVDKLLAGPIDDGFLTKYYAGLPIKEGQEQRSKRLVRLLDTWISENEQ